MKKQVVLLLALLLTGCAAVQMKELETPSSHSQEPQSVMEEQSLLPETLNGEEMTITVPQGTLPDVLPQDFINLAPDEAQQLWEEMEPWEWKPEEYSQVEAEQPSQMTLESGEISLLLLPEGMAADEEKKLLWQTESGTWEKLLTALQEQAALGAQYLDPERTMELMLKGEVTVSAMGKEFSAALTQEEAEQLREALNFQQQWEFLPQQPEKTGSELAHAQGSGYQVSFYQNYASITWGELPLCWFQLPKGLMTSLTLSLLSMGL